MIGSYRRTSDAFGGSCGSLYGYQEQLKMPPPYDKHDSNGAQAFILQCIKQVKQALPYTAIEVRMDSAIF